MLIDFSNVSDSIHKGKMGGIFLIYGLHKENVPAEMTLNKNTKTMIHSPLSDTNFFDIVVQVLEGDTFTQFLFICCRDYALWTSIDVMKEKGLSLKKGKKQTIYSINYDRHRLCRWYSAPQKLLCSRQISAAEAGALALA